MASIQSGDLATAISLPITVIIYLFTAAFTLTIYLPISPDNLLEMIAHCPDWAGDMRASGGGVYVPMCGAVPNPPFVKWVCARCV